jgi:hypothetical protein
MDLKEFIKLRLFSQKNNTIKYLVTVKLLDNFVPICSWIHKHFPKRQPKKIQVSSTLVTSSVLLGNRHHMNQVTITRDWKTKLESLQETNIMVDYVLNLISKLDNIPELKNFCLKL